jgi:V-type H+-transporting ATPase subunit e
MTAALFLGSLLFAGLGAAGAFSAPLWTKDHIGLVRILAPLCAFCMWLSYFLIYIAQLNPLILPTRNIKAE